MQLVQIVFQPRSLVKYYCEFLDVRHPRRPRGGSLGREEINRARKWSVVGLQVRRKKPLGTDSYQTISKRLYQCCLLIGQKNPMYYSAQSANSSSWGTGVCSYTTNFASLYLLGSFVNVLYRMFDLFPLAPANRPWVSEDGCSYDRNAHDNYQLFLCHIYGLDCLS